MANNSNNGQTIGAAITIDELESYTQCAKYWDFLTQGKCGLWEDRAPSDVITMACLRVLFNFKTEKGLVPEETAIVVSLATMISRAEQAGYSSPLPSVVNDINLSLLEIRRALSSEEVLQWQTMMTYHASGMVVSTPSPFVTKKKVYFVSHRSYRDFLRTSTFLVTLLSLEDAGVDITDKELVLLSISSGRITEYDLNLSKVDLARSRTHINSLLRMFREEHYPPRYLCNKISCPNWKSCKPY